METKMTHEICPKCGCRFGTKRDLYYHLDAHETYGDDLPSVRGANARYRKARNRPKSYQDFLK